MATPSRGRHDGSVSAEDAERLLIEALEALSGVCALGLRPDSAEHDLREAWERLSEVADEDPTPLRSHLACCAICRAHKRRLEPGSLPEELAQLDAPPPPQIKRKILAAALSITTAAAAPTAGAAHRPSRSQRRSGDPPSPSRWLFRVLSVAALIAIAIFVAIMGQYFGLS
jgi:hypothetical protein